MLANGGAYSKQTSLCKARAWQKMPHRIFARNVPKITSHSGLKRRPDAPEPTFAMDMSTKPQIADSAAAHNPGEAVADGAPKPVRLKFMGREFGLPRSRLTRTALGGGLIVLGIFGFLPVVGFWMIPLGALILSYDFAGFRRLRRRIAVWWGLRRAQRVRK